ncbi:MAG: PIN-like domain-containing protein, partial [Bacteroidota bacterium]
MELQIETISFGTIVKDLKLKEYVDSIELYKSNFKKTLELKEETPIFIDTNILLRYYSISFSNRKILFDFFKKYKRRIFVTSQVQKEFVKNREDIIGRFFNETLDKLEEKAEPPVLQLPSAGEKLEVLNKAWALGQQLGMDDRDKLVFKDVLRNLVIGLDETKALPSGDPTQPFRREYPISDRAIELGYRPNAGQLSQIGKIAAKRYRQEHGHDPVKREQFVGGTTRMVNTYSSDDLMI